MKNLMKLFKFNLVYFDNFWALEQNEWGIPMKHFLKEEVEMRPKYTEMAELLGMKVR